MLHPAVERLEMKFCDFVDVPNANALIYHICLAQFQTFPPMTFHD
jgi:hypothetical protein